MVEIAIERKINLLNQRLVYKLVYEIEKAFILRLSDQSGGDGGSRTRVQTGISNAYYSLSGVVFRKEKDTSEIHPSYPLE